MELFNKEYSQPGTKPGTLKQQKESTFSVNLIDYSGDVFEEISQADLSTCRTYIENDNITWIHIQGNPSVEALKNLARKLKIHDLYLEDIINVGQRPKIEINDEQMFLILSLPLNDAGYTYTEQVSLFKTQDTVISFCTGSYMPFGMLIDRIKENIGKLRKLPADYLLYNLIDTVVDFGFPLLELYAQRIQDLEDELIETKDKAALVKIHELRREILLIRRRIWPHREVINNILRIEDLTIVSKNTKLHLRDSLDHVISIMDMLETYHEMSSGLMELYLTSVSLKLNDVMKFLTIFTTVFIPPTFIVGVYGMNFNPEVSILNMPELGWQYGYVAVWAVIIASTSGMLLFFKRRKWI